MRHYIIGCVIALLLATPSFGQNGNGAITTTAELVNFPLINPCNNQLVLLSGTTHGVLRETPQHYLLQFTGHLTGTDALGNEYIANFNELRHFNFNQVTTVSNTQGSVILGFPIPNINLVTLGGGPNYFLHVNTHLTITPNGASHSMQNVVMTCTSL